MYPLGQPHPATRAHDEDWKGSIEAVGPVGLLIEAAVWHGMVIDQHLRLWQDKEEPIDILKMPYQHLKTQVHMAVGRARTRGEWARGVRPEARIREIDRKGQPNLKRPNRAGERSGQDNNGMTQHGKSGNC